MPEKTKAIIVEHFDLDKVLREVGQGYRAQIKRKEPTWCDGLIDTIELDADDPISMDFLKQEYGGRKLQIVIQDADGNYVTARTVKFPDPPKKEGRELKRWEEERPAVPQSNGAGLLGEMKSIFELMLTSQEKQLAGIIDSFDRRLDAVERSRPGDGGGRNVLPFDHIKQSLSTIKQINTLKEEMGIDSAPQASEENSITRAVDKFTDLMIEKEQAKIKREIETHTAAQTAPPLPPSSQYTPPQQQAQEPAESTAESTTAAISGLSDVEFAAHVKNRLDALEPEERAEIINQFAEMYDLEEDVEENDSESVKNEVQLGSVKVIDDDGDSQGEQDTQSSDLPLNPAG